MNNRLSSNKEFQIFAKLQKMFYPYYTGMFILLAVTPLDKPESI